MRAFTAYGAGLFCAPFLFTTAYFLNDGVNIFSLTRAGWAAQCNACISRAGRQHLD